MSTHVTRRERVAAALLEELDRQGALPVAAPRTRDVPVNGTLDVLALADVVLATSRAEADISPSYLARRLVYCRDTGELHWRMWAGDPEWSRIHAGRIADAPRADGARELVVDGVRLLSHRAAMAIVLGRWPLNDVGHRNGDRGDNRFTNLRVAPRGALRQGGASPLGETGFRGVTRAGGRFRASLVKDGRRRELGLYDRPEDAARAVDRALLDYWGPEAETNAAAGRLPEEVV